MKGKRVLAGAVVAILLALAAGLSLAQLPEGTPLGTAFTYQGYLKSGGQPVDDTCDLQFALWDAETGGAQIGPLEDRGDVDIRSGLFTVKLDFATGSFQGEARWLEIAVLCPGDPGYTTLAPRQALTPSPYALALPGLWTQQNITSTNLIGGFSGNWVADGAYGVTISGGGYGSRPNRVTDVLGTVGGGGGNEAGSNDGDIGNGVYATVGGGRLNTAGDWAASVLGGSENTAGEEFSAVGGGSHNVASGWSATISGGYYNTAPGDRSTVGGGAQNAAEGDYSTVGGGLLNVATGITSTISGGQGNGTLGDWSVVGGGLANWAWGPGGTVGGGSSNLAGQGATISGGTSNWADVGAAISGGTSNTASGENASIGGGIDNDASGSRTTIAGGEGNLASQPWSTIGGGAYNLTGGADTDSATVSGGHHNTANGHVATIGGGCWNYAAGLNATVSGGVSNTATGDTGFIGGGASNLTSANMAAVVGGDSNTASGVASFVGGGQNHSAAGDASTIGGGWSNSAQGTASTISGGENNHATARWGTVAGGNGNTASGDFAPTVSGGQDNTASAGKATVSGGWANVASGYDSTIPGGSQNQAQGHTSFAAGRRAVAQHDGALVWADRSDYDFLSGGVNSFNARATGGFFFWTGLDGSGNPNVGAALYSGSSAWSPLSDRNLKTNVTPVDSAKLLAALAEVPVTTWSYTTQDPSIRHIGPMAQDFYAAFGVGEDERHISTVDADGVALGAIQGLYAENQALRAENARQQKQIDDLDARLSALEQGAAGERPARSSVRLPVPWLLAGGLFVAGGALAGWRRRAGGVR
ncbi:MAG TPA: tail fiber domain-containing protein [Anaerolineae bacterium]|nr:tail fiber domain-containing protein [Anaerolineae bacterium]